MKRRQIDPETGIATVLDRLASFLWRPWLTGVPPEAPFPYLPGDIPSPGGLSIQWPGVPVPGALVVISVLPHVLKTTPGRGEETTWELWMRPGPRPPFTRGQANHTASPGQPFTVNRP